MRKLKLFFACLLMAVLSIGQIWAADSEVTISYSDIPDGYTQTTGTSGSFTKTVATANDLTINYAGINTKSSATAADHSYGYAMFLKNNGFVYSGAAPTGYYPSNVVVTFGSNTGTSGKAGITYGSSALSERNSSVTGAVTKSGTCTLANTVTTNVYWNFSTTGANVQVDNIKVTYSPVGSSTSCATPTFSPAAGAVLSGTEVTISSSTDGATIHYTTDGTDPTASSATAQPIEITSETTIKAIAVKDGLSNSSVASATYTIATPLTTMQEIFDAATTTATPQFITFSSSWVVTGVSTNGKNVYITDGTKGMILYNNGANMGLVVGNTLSGTVQRSLKLYNGSAQLDAFTTEGLTIGTGSQPAVQELDATGIEALSGANTGSLIKISGECTSASSKYYVAGVQLYNTLFAFTNPTVGTNYECTGVFQLYTTNTSSTKEILPRSAADIIAQTSVATPTFSPGTGEYTETQNVTISCATDGTTIYYTTDGSAPTSASTAYTGAIAVSATMTIKAIAYKGEDHSEVASATYTMNIPIPAHDFQVIHKFETGEGFEFPSGWTSSYAAHEIAFTDDKVVFAEANQPSSTSAINDCPVTKEKAISLVLTNSAKLISAVRFDYKQWGTKTQTLTMKYSTDGGSTYSAFSPAVTSTEFALQVLDLPEGTNAIQVTGSSANQVGLTKISFDMVDKPIVTKTVTITAPSNGTLVVKNGATAISSGDAIEVGTSLAILATPAEGYSLDAISVLDEDAAPVTVTEGVFEVPNKNVTVSATFVEDARPVASLILSENGNEVTFPGSHKQNDHVTLPTTVSHTCANRVFVGWIDVEVAKTDEKPSYLEPGADFVLSAAGENKLYAVYAAEGAATSNYKLSAQAPADGETVIMARLVESTYYAMTTAATPSSSELTLTAGVVESPADAVLWDVEEATEGVYLRPTGTTDGLHMNSSALKVANGDTNGDIKFTSNGDGSFKATRADNARWIVTSGTNSFGCSATEANAVALYIFKAIHNYSKYSTTCDAAIDAPEFTPDEGTYTTAQSVTISAAAGATIYYTMTSDGSTPADPTTSSDVYSDAISLDVAGTYKFKAYAVKGEAESDITVATYTINLPLTTMEAIFAKANEVGSTKTDVTIVFDNWVISGVSTNGKQAYLTDGTKGLIIFDNTAAMGFAVGDKLNGTAACKLEKYNGASELTSLTSTTEGLTVSTGGVVTPVVKTIDALSGVNTGAPIIVNNVTFDGTNLTDGSNNIKPYTTLYDAAITSLTTNKYYNVTGIYTQFNTTKEILPRSAADIELVGDKEAPTMTWYTSSAKTATIAANAKYTINLSDAFAPLFETNSPGELTYGSSNAAVAEINETTGELILQGAIGETTITCAVAAAGNFTAGSQGFILKVRESATVDRVVILVQFNNGSEDKWLAMKHDKTAVEVNYSEGKIVNMMPVESRATIVWKRTVDSEGNVTFQDPSTNNYLKGSGSTTLTVEAGESGAYQWKWNETYYRVGTETRTFLYQGNSAAFKNFATSNAGKTADGGYSQLPVVTTAVFVSTTEPDFKRTSSEMFEPGAIGTLCVDHNVPLEGIEGATFYELAGLTEVGKLAFDEIVFGELEAGVPYLFQANSDELKLYYGTTSVAAPVYKNNGLHGSFENFDLTGDDLEDVYYFANRKFWSCENVSVLHVVANRAYLKLSEVPEATPNTNPARRRIIMGINGANSTTGFDNIESDGAPRKQLINGTIYIIRGEKVYDATGRLVK